MHSNETWTKEVWGNCTFFQLNLASSNFFTSIENITKVENYHEASCVYRKSLTPITNWCDFMFSDVRSEYALKSRHQGTWLPLLFHTESRDVYVRVSGSEVLFFPLLVSDPGLTWAYYVFDICCAELKDILACAYLLLPLLVGFLFGTSLQKLFGELFGFHCVP